MREEEKEEEIRDREAQELARNGMYIRVLNDNLYKLKDWL